MAGEPIPAPAQGSDRLKQTVLKMLQYDPRNRIQSASELYHMLEQCRAEIGNADALSVSKIPAAEKEYERTIPVVSENATERTIPVAPEMRIEENVPVVNQSTAKSFKKVFLLSSVLVLFIVSAVVLLMISGNHGERSQKENELTQDRSVIASNSDDWEKAEDPTQDEPAVESDAEHLEEGKLSRVNYYDFDGEMVYYDSYVYYDNGLLCSSTLHWVDCYDGVIYNSAVMYTALYLYDEEGNLEETMLGAPVIDSWYDEATGEIILDKQYADNGEIITTSIFPLRESIEQEKFNVDSSRTEKIYGEAPVIYSDLDGNWTEVYLNQVFTEENEKDSITVRFIYVDDDQVPELWLEGASSYFGNDIFTINHDTTDSIVFEYGAAEWIEYGNLMLVSWDYIGKYTDIIYKIEDGEFVVVSSGTHGVMDPSILKLDENGNSILEYYWNNEEVTEEEYAQNLADAFDKSQASGEYVDVYSYEQCKALLKVLGGHSDEVSEDSGEGKNQPLSDEMLQEISSSLGVPDDLDVEFKQYDRYYWEGGCRFLIEVNIYYEGEVVAGAAVDADTGELIRNIYNYSGDGI